jgi:hypothetical protein
VYHDGQQHGFWVNPPENITCHPGIVVIVLGDMKNIHEAREQAARRAHFATT